MAPLVFITGASSGIGQALAQRYLAAGWHLALPARRPAELSAWAAAQGWPAERWRVYGADVAAVDSIVAAGQACIAEQGVPQVVIANAGISVGMDTAERADLDVMARTFAVNNLGLAATFPPFVEQPHLVAPQVDDLPRARVDRHARALGSRWLTWAFGPLVVATAPPAATIVALARAAGWATIERHADDRQPVYLLRLA